MRSHHVEELVPKLRASLAQSSRAGGEGAYEHNRSAVAAAVGLGMPSSVGGAPAGAAAAAAGAALGTSCIACEAAAVKKAPGSASARASLASKENIFSSLLRTSGVLAPGCAAVTLRCYPSDMSNAGAAGGQLPLALELAPTLAVTATFVL